MNYSPSFSSTTPGFVSGNLTSKSSTPFLLVPNRNRSSSSKKSRPKPSFPISNKSNAQQQPQQPQPAPAQPARVPVPSASTSTSLPQQFKPPAHKHAHHLHSIPPREKSTRSLILDHMLFLLGKARFAQARAELGMGGWHNAKRELLGAGSPPPSGDLGSEHESEGEGVEVVGFGLQGSDRRQNRPDTLNRAENADSNMAQSFKSRAEGLEKVRFPGSFLDYIICLSYNVGPLSDARSTARATSYRFSIDIAHKLDLIILPRIIKTRSSSKRRSTPPSVNLSSQRRILSIRRRR
jgi:hypothetical protein